MKVVMMRQKSLESSIEKSDQNSVDGMRQEVYLFFGLQVKYLSKPELVPRLHLIHVGRIQVSSTCIRIQVVRPGYL